jgi:hypothetical protein
MDAKQHRLQGDNSSAECWQKPKNAQSNWAYTFFELPKPFFVCNKILPVLLAARNVFSHPISPSLGLCLRGYLA